MISPNAISYTLEAVLKNANCKLLTQMENVVMFFIEIGKKCKTFRFNAHWNVTKIFKKRHKSYILYLSAYLYPQHIYNMLSNMDFDVFTAPRFFHVAILFIFVTHRPLVILYCIPLTEIRHHIILWSVYWSYIHKDVLR